MFNSLVFTLCSHLGLQCVYASGLASTMILLFDMWIENVANVVK